MKKLIIPLLLTAALLCGCSAETTEAVATAAISAAEEIVTALVENVDWDEVEGYVRDGYNALVEEYPALKEENIKAFLKDNGLELLNKYVSSGDETMQENARKLGEIIKILNPELSDEVDSVIAE